MSTQDVRERKLAQLPPGIRFQTGVLEIEFQNAAQLLGSLFELAQAIHNDYQQFEALIAQFVPICPATGGKT